MAALLGGCATLEAVNPVNWWHDMQGGKIAEQRPAPPGAADAWPNLSTVPSRPAPPDRDAMKKLTESLVADRANAQYTAEAAPLPDPSSAAASPGLFGGGAARPPAAPAPSPAAPRPAAAAGAASASFAAASAPPAEVVTPPSRAPVSPVRSAPLAPPEEPVAPAATPPSADAAAMPALPTREPPRPSIAPPAPPPAPVAVAPMPAPGGAGQTVIQFPGGGATLSPTAQDAIKQFAAQRLKATSVQPDVLVTGHGDAASSDPTVQSVALSLGLSRAQAVANALIANGVPSAAIRLGSEAAGRGASLRLLQ